MLGLKNNSGEKMKEIKKSIKKNTKSHKKWMLNENGFGITEGIIAAGVVAIVVSGMSSFMNMQSNNVRRMNVK